MRRMLVACSIVALLVVLGVAAGGATADATILQYNPSTNTFVTITPTYGGTTPTTSTPTTSTTPTTSATSGATAAATTTWVPSTSSIQTKINATPAGGTVILPAGTFTISSQISLKSGVRLQGAGIDKTILYMTAKSTSTNLLSANGISNGAVSDLTLKASSPTGNVLGLHLMNTSNITVERVKTVNCTTGIKVDTRGYNLVFRNLVSRTDRVAFYLSKLNTATFQGLDIADSTSSSVYVAANNYHLKFNAVTIARAGGWGVQLWYDAGWATPSDDITFTDLTVSGHAPFVIGRGYTHITLSGLKATSTSYECVRLYDPRYVTVENFTATGGPSVIATADDATVPNAQNVTVRNGTYTEPRVAEAGIKVTNLLISGVTRVY